MNYVVIATIVCFAIAVAAYCNRRRKDKERRERWHYEFDHFVRYRFWPRIGDEKSYRIWIDGKEVRTRAAELTKIAKLVRDFSFKQADEDAATCFLNVELDLNPKSPGPESSWPRIFGLLAAFKWFCATDDREMVVVIEADLKRDCTDMRREGRSSTFIQFVLFKRIVFGTVIPILWDAAMRVLRKLVDAAELLKRLKF